MKKQKTKVVKITASCGGSGCAVQPYILPYGIKKAA